jgi:3-mercaptopyruvate sulfurtransferase SseA
MKARGGGVIVNDIGAAGEKFDANYICGSAGNAALMAFTRALGGKSLADNIRVVGITQNTPVYLYCFKGARASNTFLALKNAGVKDVRMYFGSWNEWSRDPSLPIEEGLPMEAKLTEAA